MSVHHSEATTGTSGAYNGTGMAILQLGTSYQDYTWHLYYQHATGELRDLELNNYEWVPASNTGVDLPASVKNGTPLAVASYEVPKSPPTVYISTVHMETTILTPAVVSYILCRLVGDITRNSQLGRGR